MIGGMARVRMMVIALGISGMAVAPGEVDPRVEFAFGVLEEARGAASERFEVARVADPLALPLVRRAVDARLAAGDRAGAVKLFRDLAAARPGEPGVQLLYADFLMREGGGDSMAESQAVAALETVLAAHPGNPAAIGRLFEIDLAAGRKGRALTRLDGLAKDDPAAAVTYAALARRAGAADDADQRTRTDEHYELSLAAAPSDPRLAREAAEYFRNSGRLQKAIAVLERHVEAAPSSLALRTRLGVLYFVAKEDDKGEAVLKRVLEIDPNQALAHQSLAKLYKLRGMPELERFHGGELLKLRGGPAADFLALADGWLAAGEPRQARLLLEKAVFDHPGDSALAVKLAIAARRDPETRDKAARLFREAEAARKPGEKPDPAFSLEFARALQGEGQAKAAEERLRDAIRGFPPEAKSETAAALRQLAELWESQGRNADAAKALRQRAEGLDK